MPIERCRLALPVNKTCSTLAGKGEGRVSANASTGLANMFPHGFLDWLIHTAVCTVFLGGIFKQKQKIQKTHLLLYEVPTGT